MEYFLNLYCCCLEDDFNGHHYPDVCIPIDSSTTVRDMTRLLKSAILRDWDRYVYPEAMLKAAGELRTSHSLDHPYFIDVEIPDNTYAVFLGIPV